MGRKRRNEDRWMPPRVYRGRSAFEYHPKGGGAIRLCALTAKRSTVWEAYEAAIEKEQANFKRLFEMYFASPQFLALSKASQIDYRQSHKKLLPVFRDTNPEQVTSPNIRAYMDMRGTKAPIRANRELAFMGTVFSWAKERGLVSDNPCRDVRRFKESSRKKYITDEEYIAVYAIAPRAIKVAMEIAYLCAARQGDVLGLKWEHVLDKGIYIKQGKTGKEQIKLWSPRLRMAIDLAKTGVINRTHVICNTRGQRYTRSGFNSIWLAAKEQAGLTGEFTFHDLKAKGVTDYVKGNKQEFSGHFNPAQTEIYNRKIQEVEAHG